MPPPGPAAEPDGRRACTLFRGATGPAVTLAFREVDDGVLPPLGHPTILIIDDDTQSRDWLAATLSVEGFDVVTAADGDEGVALVHRRRPR